MSSRSQSRAAASSNSSRPTTATKKKVPAQTLPQLNKELAASQSLSNTGHLLNAPSPIYKPYISPGVKGKPGETLYVGNLSPDETAQPGNKWRFIFHWNPSEIDLDTSTSYNASVAPAAQYTNDAHLLFVATTSLSFQVMIERQEETFLQTPLGHPMKLQYGSNRPHGLNATTFADVGTLYDLEVLYRVINGPVDQSAASVTKGSPAISAPYILANPLFCTFGKSLQFYGYVNDLSVNHIMFTPGMVPIVTYLQISMTAYSLKNPYIDTAKAKIKQIKKERKRIESGSGFKIGPVLKKPGQ